MQELILIISRCISKRKSVKTGKHYYRFHFKGYYSGLRIKVIYLHPKCINAQLVKGEDYLLWVKKVSVAEEVLEVDLIKYKRIM